MILFWLIRTLVAKSEDALTNPELIYENVARVKRLVDSLGYSGPVAAAADCTKVCARLTYSSDFGNHILGSILPLHECIVNDADDITSVIKHIMSMKATASQVRAILLKVCNLVPYYDQSG